MKNVSRRSMLAATAFGGVAAAGAAAAQAPGVGGVFGNPDRPAEGALNANPNALSDPGPQNPAVANQFPSFLNPPPTDVNGMEQIRASFNEVPRRIQAGGWARQVTQGDFAVSETISGVNMRLSAGGIRELHWHQQAEWAVVTDGKCRITVLDYEGRTYVRDVGVNGLWYFPAGLPHSLQGLGPSGTEFVIAFDNGRASEFNTLLLTDFIAHTPPDALAENFNLPVSAFKNIPVNNKWIYQGAVPPPLAQVQAQVKSPLGPSNLEFTFDFNSVKPISSTRGGEVKVADSTNFHISKTIASTMVTIKPGAMRELHWHPNQDEWQYYLKGSGRATVFNTGPEAMTADFRAGDIGYVKKSFGHYIKNTGNTDLVFMEIFKADRFENVSLRQWLATSPPEMVSQLLNMDPSLVKQFNRARADVVPI